MKIKFLIIGGSPSHVGGLERYCARFVSAFKKFAKSEVDWLHSNTALSSKESLLAYLRRVFTAQIGVLSAVRRLNNNRNNVVWVQYGNAFDLVTLFLTRLVFNGKIFCTMHAGPQWKHLKHTFTRKICLYLLDRADHICTFAEWQKEFLAEFGISKTCQIPTLLPEWINHDHESLYERSGFLFAGRISPEKGVDDLLKAYKIVMGQLIEEKLHIAGGGDADYIRSCKKLADDLDIGGHISWEGLLDEESLHEMMRKCKILIYPSFADAFSLTVLEGLASDINVIAYDIPGTDEIVRRFGGTVVRPGDVTQLANAILSTAKNGHSPGLQQIVKQELCWSNVVSTYEEIVYARI